jgi:energy-coupling factor transporter ATP-binding protein EcfA2
MPFQRAVKRAAKLRLALVGPSGSGKTYTALAIAAALAAADDGRPNAAGLRPSAGSLVAVVDTERGSASKYADLWSFDVLELDTYHPDRYIEAIREAEAGGYAVLVIDSLSHAWAGKGGLLEVHDQIVKRQKVKNSYTAWSDVTPQQTRLVDALTSAKLHVIATMRAKTEYVLQTEDGKQVPKRVGMAPIQREGMEYEFDVVGELSHAHRLVVEKSRCPELSGAVVERPGAEVAAVLAAWLEGVPAPSLPPRAAVAEAEAPTSAAGSARVVAGGEPIAPAPVAPAPVAPAPAGECEAAKARKPVPSEPLDGGNKPPRWADLHERLKALGLCESREEFAELIQFHTGKLDGRELTGRDYAKVAAHVRALEQERAEEERVVAAAEAAVLGASEGATDGTSEGEEIESLQVEFEVVGPAPAPAEDPSEDVEGPEAPKRASKRLAAKAGVH